MTPLRQRMINDMTVRGLANSTMASYLRSVTRLARHYPDFANSARILSIFTFFHDPSGLNCWSPARPIHPNIACSADLPY